MNAFIFGDCSLNRQSAPGKEKGRDAPLNEKRTLKALRRGEPAALSEIIRQYTPYVYAIARNILSPALPPEDIEETVSDVFCALWYSRDGLESGKLKSWLAVTARNAARDRLRRLRLIHPLDEDMLDISLPDMEQALAERELAAACREAVDSLGEPDREIFQRRYFLYQKTEDIAREMGLGHSAVRSRLMRGRTKLREYLEERGWAYADQNY